MGSIRKQPTLRDANISLRIKWLMRSACRDSILRTYHYPDLGSAFDWSYGDGNLLQPIRSRTQIWALSSRSDAGKPMSASSAVFSGHLWKRRSCFIIINSPFTWNILGIGGVVASTGFPAKWDLRNKHRNSGLRSHRSIVRSFQAWSFHFIVRLFHSFSVKLDMKRAFFLAYWLTERDILRSNTLVSACGFKTREKFWLLSGAIWLGMFWS